jgi:hypothetical protein
MRLIGYAGGYRRQLVLLVFISILGQACSSSSEPVVEPWKMGEQHRSEVIPYQKLRAKIAGWQLWEVVSKEGAACVAIRIAEGASQPRISIEDRTVTGDGGFYMFVAEHVDLPYFGFYGQYGYPRSVRAEVDGRPISDVNDQDAVLSWEGRKVGFQVVTQTYEGIYPDQFRAPGIVNLDLGNLLNPKASANTGDQQGETVGEVDFSGVEETYRVLKDCRLRIAGSR